MDSWRQRFEEQLIFATPTVQVGRFQIEAADPGFSQGRRPGHYLAAFPETSVEIHNPRCEPFVTDRTLATLYNPEDVYRRRARDQGGDRCWWLSLTEAELRQVLAPDRRSNERLMPFPVAPCTDSAFLLQRLIVGWCQDPGSVREESVEGAAKTIVRELIRAGSTAALARTTGSAASSSRWLVAKAREVLRKSFRRSLSLEQIGTRVGCSPYHLSRVFRQATGTTLHGYRTTLRLRTGVDELLSRRGEINGVAFALGFASHSHFTDFFRRAFGLTPSRFLRLVDGAEMPPVGTLARGHSPRCAVSA